MSLKVFLRNTHERAWHLTLLLGWIIRAETLWLPCQQVAHQLDSPSRVRSYTRAWQSRGQLCQTGAWHESEPGGVWREELEWWNRRSMPLKKNKKKHAESTCMIIKKGVFSDYLVHLQASWDPLCCRDKNTEIWHFIYLQRDMQSCTTPLQH